MLKIKKTRFKDLFVIEGKMHKDRRGYLRELIIEKKIKKKFKFQIISKSKINVLRGLHFQYKKPHQTLNTHTSLGIEIIQERIRLMNEKKGVTIAHLKYLVKSNGTHIQLILPKY